MTKINDWLKAASTLGNIEGAINICHSASRILIMKVEVASLFSKILHSF